VVRLCKGTPPGRALPTGDRDGIITLRDLIVNRLQVYNYKQVRRYWTRTKYTSNLSFTDGWW
jgi:hypothetical protein